MSLFRTSDFAQKNQTRVMKKTRLPTEFKTKKHKCSKCTRPYAVKTQVSEKEWNWLCIVCINQNKKRDEKHPVNFVKAGKL